MNKTSGFLLIGIFLLCLTACTETYTPKPRAFPKIEYPERTFKPFVGTGCDFSFEQPTYSTYKQEKYFFGDRAPHPCWFDLDMPVFNGKVHMSYKPIDAKTDIGELVNDAYRLANKHQKRASYVDDHLIRNQHGVSGIVYEMEGHSASPFQFFLTDSSQHFLRGSLYFSQPNPDSMRPVIEFVKEDLVHMINTFKWSN